MTSLFEVIEKKEHGLSEKFGDLMSRVFAKMWPDSAEELAILTHCLTWSAFSLYLKLVRKYTKDRSKMSETNYFNTVLPSTQCRTIL